jgi:hypothetical protein
MLLPEVYAGPAIIDGRAARRDTYPPKWISVRAMGTGSVSHHIDLAVRSQPTPCAYITVGGDVWILTGGGSGVIAFGGDDPTIDQGDRISLLVEALETLGGEVEGMDEPVEVPKRKRKSEPVAVIAEVVEVVGVPEAWAVDDEGQPF